MAKFCVKCGSPLGTGPFCVKCGADMRNIVTPAQPQPPQPVAQMPVAQATPSASSVPAKQGMGTLAKLGIAEVAIIFVGGVAGAVGVYSVAHRVSQKVHQGEDRILGSRSDTGGNDPLTGLPLSPATYGGQYIGNEPDKMPDGQVCKGKMQGNNYSLFDIKTDAAIPWYASHLAGFKKIQGYESGRSQTAFYNSDGSIVIFLTAQPGTQGENTDAYSVAYERFQPGISEKNDLCLNARENNLPVTT
jgi:hypothetical protein